MQYYQLDIHGKWATTRQNYNKCGQQNLVSLVKVSKNKICRCLMFISTKIDKVLQFLLGS